MSPKQRKTYVADPNPALVEFRLKDGCCPKCDLKSVNYSGGGIIAVHCSSTCGSQYYNEDTYQETDVFSNPFRDERTI